MRIIGIDPGSIITGIGIIEFNVRPELVKYDVINLSSKTALTLRLKKIYDECITVLKRYKPEMLSIETAFYGKNIQSTLKLGQARGVAIIAALNMGIEVYEYTPREIKKSVTGSGSASKNVVQNYVKRILSIKDEIRFSDSSDALATALCHYYRINNLSVRKSKSFSGIIEWAEYINKHPEKILKPKSNKK